VENIRHDGEKSHNIWATLIIFAANAQPPSNEARNNAVNLSPYLFNIGMLHKAYFHNPFKKIIFDAP
jgi:hypothetical protein